MFCSFYLISPQSEYLLVEFISSKVCVHVRVIVCHLSGFKNKIYFCTTYFVYDVWNFTEVGMAILLYVCRLVSPSADC